MSRLNKQQIKILIIVVSGLILIISLIYLQQTGFFRDRSLPQTEEQAKKTGQDIEQIKLTMNSPTSINEISFQFNNLSNVGVPNLQLEQLKEVLFRELPSYKEYYVKEDIKVDYIEGETVVEFILVANNTKEYKATITYLSYDLRLTLTDNDVVIYTSPTS